MTRARQAVCLSALLAVACDLALADETDVAELQRHAFEVLGATGPTANMAEAARLLEQASDAGSGAAAAQLAYMYSNGVFFDGDHDKAMQLYRLAAERGIAAGQAQIGSAYLRGDGVEKNFDEARLWLQAAANQGDAWSLATLGAMYVAGQGVEQDVDLGFDYTLRAAELGLPSALRDIGMMFLDYPKKRDPEKARYALERAAKDFPIAARRLGLELLRGRLLPRDLEAAAGWISRAAADGDPLTNLLLAELLERGLGLTPNPAFAKVVRARALEQASPSVKNSFAWLLSVSREDILRDGDTAVAIMEELLEEPDLVTVERLDTLAAAYAEAGRLDDAVATQKNVIARWIASADALSSAAYESRLSTFQRRLDLYRAGRPYRLED